MESSASIFLGTFEHAIDGKNRLFLPAKFRSKNSSAQFIMTQGLEQCLFLFPRDAWNALASKLDSLPLADKVEERAFKRILLSGAAESEVDGQGRVLIPQSLKEYADIDRDAVIIGVLRHVEIWAKERWERYRKVARQSFDKAAPHLEI